MTKYNPKIHHRRSIRLKGYDYSKEGLYFITICCQDRKHLFGKITDREMTLNNFGLIVLEEWEKTTAIRDNTRLHEFIIMPNHFHAIIEILYSKKKEEDSQKENSNSIMGDSNIESSEKESSEMLRAIPISLRAYCNTPRQGFKSPSQTIGAIIRGFKGATTKKIKEIYFSKGKDSKFNINPNKSIWQRNYYENIIRDERAYHNISEYIKNNPANWKGDKFH